MKKASLFQRIQLYFHTIKFLKWIQIRYQLYYQFKRSVLNKRPVLPTLNRALPNVTLPKLSRSIPSYRSYLSVNTFRFLNQEKSFSEKVDWNFSKHGKLWTYNLTYFEFLQQTDIKKEDGLQLIDQFIRDSDSIIDGFEPFPISLRAINWIKFNCRNEVNLPQFNEHLYRQLMLLTRNLEFHLLGNHLLENGFALLFGGIYFKDTGFLKIAERILFTQLEEQILEDGAHFELSPMYHQLMLFRILDCINLIQNNVNPQLDGLQTLLAEKAALMLGWIKTMTFRNGTPPLFNDSTNEISPSTQALIEYGEALQIFPLVHKLGSSGYRKFEDKNFEIIMDGGSIGPDYIPGHGHADITNFALHIGGSPFIVDTGVSTYEKNEKRQYERSTAAHNIVSIIGQDQSEVWGGFRVARRSYGKIIEESDMRLRIGIESADTLYHGVERIFELDGDKIRIKDRVPNNMFSCASLHFSPGVEAYLEKGSVVTPICEILFTGFKELSMETYDYAMGFNQTQKALKVRVLFSNQLETLITL